MRVSLAQSYDKMTRNINRQKEDMSLLSLQGSTGKRILKPEDDPLAWAQSLEMKQGLREFEAFGRNIEFGMGWTRTTESALNSFADLLVRARETAMKAISATSSEERVAHVETMNQISAQALKLANSQYGDMYIFSGRKTSTAPFAATDLTAYSGDPEDFMIRTGRNTRQTINLNGRTVFFTDQADDSSNMLKTLDDLRVAIRDTDSAGIQAALGALDTAHKQILNMSSTIGTRLGSLEDQNYALESLKIDQQEQLAELEGADMAEVITQLQQKRTAFEAALQVTALLDNLNLTRFL